MAVLSLGCVAGPSAPPASTPSPSTEAAVLPAPFHKEGNFTEAMVAKSQSETESLGLDGSDHFAVPNHPGMLLLVLEWKPAVPTNTHFRAYVGTSDGKVVARGDGESPLRFNASLEGGETVYVVLSPQDARASTPQEFHWIADYAAVAPP
jgi:hypothetical protein